MRRRSLFSCTLLLLLLAAAAVPALAQDGALRKELQAAYDKMAAGIAKKDIKPMIGYLAADFSNEGPDGQKQGREELEAEFTGYMKMVTRVDQVSLKIRKLEVNGDQAVADVAMKLRVQMNDANGDFGEKGKAHRLEMDSVEQETWVKGDQGWKIRASKSLPGGKFLVDGKPLGPSGAPAEKK